MIIRQYCLRQLRCLEKNLPLKKCAAPFGELYALGTQAFCECGAPGVYALAAVGENGDRAAMLTNVGEDALVTLAGDGAALTTVYLVDETHALTAAQVINGSFMLCKNQTALLR